MSEPINKQVGLSYTADDEELYIEVVQEYLADVPDKIKQISAYEKTDMENYTIMVHALKSASRTIGAEQLADTAYQCELAGKDRNQSRIEELTPVLMKELEEVVSYLQQNVTGEKTAEAGDTAESSA